jgi:hypothetical protein
MGHVAAPELPCARRRDLEPRGHVAALGPGGKSWSHEARGSSKAALC